MVVPRSSLPTRFGSLAGLATLVTAIVVTSLSGDTGEERIHGPP